MGLTVEEWHAAIDFLTRTGQTSTATRQEFILLSDVLGASMLVETINNRADGGLTESTVEGPFHVVASPPRELGDTIALDGKGEPCLVTGTVTGSDGKRIAGATVDVWQANDDGFYDVQQPGIQPDLNLRGLFTTDARARSGSARSCPGSTRSRRTGPSGSCWRRGRGTRTGQRTCTSRSRRPATGRSPRTCSSTAPSTSTPMRCSGG